MFVIAMLVTVSSVQINHEDRNSTALQLNRKAHSCCSLLLIPQLLQFVSNCSVCRSTVLGPGELGAAEVHVA